MISNLFCDTFKTKYCSKSKNKTGIVIFANLSRKNDKMKIICSNRSSNSIASMTSWKFQLESRLPRFSLEAWMKEGMAIGIAIRVEVIDSWKINLACYQKRLLPTNQVPFKGLFPSTFILVEKIPMTIKFIIKLN